MIPALAIALVQVPAIPIPRLVDSVVVILGAVEPLVIGVPVAVTLVLLGVAAIQDLLILVVRRMAAVAHQAIGDSINILKE